MAENKQTESAMLMQLLQDMAEVKTIVKRIGEHETRIRELERARWANSWLTGVLSAAIASVIVATIIRLTMGE